MNKRFLYALCIVSQVLWSVQVMAQAFQLGFVNIAITSESCLGNDGTITVMAQGDNLAEVLYILNPGEPNQIANNTGIFTGLSAGDYTIRLLDQVTRITRDARVAVLPLIPLFVSSVIVRNVRVAGEATGSIILETRGGLGQIAVTAEPFEGLLAKSQAIILKDAIISLQNLVAGTYQITLQSQDNCLPIVLFVQVVEPVI